MKKIKAEVVHMRNYGKKTRIIGDTLYIYCGRPSKLGNPYSMRNESDRGKVIEQFKNDSEMKKKVKGLKVELLRRGFTKVKLGCFCSPKACHCDIIKKRLEK